MLRHSVGLHTESQSLLRQISIRHIRWRNGLPCNLLLFDGRRKVDTTPWTLSNYGHELDVHPASSCFVSNVAERDWRIRRQAHRTTAADCSVRTSGAGANLELYASGLPIHTGTNPTLHPSSSRQSKRPNERHGTRPGWIRRLYGPSPNPGDYRTFCSAIVR